MGRDEWFRSWFGEEYLRLYPHRDREEAAQAVRLLLEVVGRPSGRWLDLACGAGRHLLELRRAGIEAVGLDLSQVLLRRARRSASPAFQLVRADMRRLPFRDGSFVAVTSFFTSFGYFASPGDDALVAREIRRSLVAGGCFLLDFLHATRVRKTLVPSEEKEIDGRSVQLTRSIEGDAVVKRIRISAGDGDEPREYEERVRLYSPRGLEALLRAAGLPPTARFGGYDGRPLDASSPRVLFLGRAA